MAERIFTRNRMRVRRRLAYRAGVVGGLVAGVAGWWGMARAVAEEGQEAVFGGGALPAVLPIDITFAAHLLLGLGVLSTLVLLRRGFARL